MNIKKPFKIGILGAESTGKSTLARQLAELFSAEYVPEYAREYVERLSAPYTYEDVENIARKQIQQLLNVYCSDLVFFDTELIITKVWFEVKYSVVPDWFMQAYMSLKPNFCLLCMPDLPFVADPVRENAHLREQLTEMYKHELELSAIPYGIVSGSGATRLENAIKIVQLQTKYERL